MQAFREADRQVGGGYMYGAVVHYLEKEVGPLLFKGSADRFCAAAALTEMAGWMAHDGGDDARAHQHFDRALRFASATNDVELAAHVHASLSHLLQQLDRPRDGLRLAQAGRSDPPAPRSPPGAQRPSVRDGGTRARHAASPRRLRTRAHDRRARARPRPPRRALPWVSPFDHASLAAEASVCMQQLEQLAAARAALRAGAHASQRQSRPQSSIRPAPSRRHPRLPGRDRARLRDGARRAREQRPTLIQPRRRAPAHALRPAHAAFDDPRASTTSCTSSPPP